MIEIKMEAGKTAKDTLFISGPITGVPEYWKAFKEAADFYRNHGFIVITPSDLPMGLDNADYARICLSMIDSVEWVAFLPGWENSPGAQLEHKYCEYVGKKIRSYEVDFRTDERFKHSCPCLYCFKKGCATCTRC